MNRRLGEWPTYQNDAVRLRAEQDWRTWWGGDDDSQDFWARLMRPDNLESNRHYPGMWPFELALANHHFEEYIQDAFESAVLTVKIKNRKGHQANGAPSSLPEVAR